jgi:hypothetical protein
MVADIEGGRRGRCVFRDGLRNLSLHERFRLYEIFWKKISTTFSIRPPVCEKQTVAAGSSTNEKAPKGARSLVLSPGIEHYMFSTRSGYFVRHSPPKLSLNSFDSLGSLEKPDPKGAGLFQRVLSPGIEPGLRVPQTRVLSIKL